MSAKFKQIISKYQVEILLSPMSLHKNGTKSKGKQTFLKKNRFDNE